MRIPILCLGLLFLTMARADDGGLRGPRLRPPLGGPPRVASESPPTAEVVPPAAAMPSAATPDAGSVVDAPTAPNANAPVETTGAPALVEAAKGNPLWSVPLTTLSATRERPLFSPTRRPPDTAAPPPPPPRVAAPPPAPAAAAAETPPFTLLGTVLSANTSLAILLNTTTNEVTRLRLGQSEAGWTAQKVDLRAAVLAKDGVESTLELPKTTDAPADASAAAPTGDANNQGTQ